MNYDKLERLKELEPIKKVDSKDANSIRVVLFNINGAKTIFNYYPWNNFSSNFGLVFSCLQADIISLQELKVSNNDLSSSIELGNLSNYKSFITLPKSKKGYSGVGLFVRIPDQSESEAIQSNLLVLKAEEGLTGELASALDSRKKYMQLDSEVAIGGYVDDIDPELALRLDNEGRCIVIELANNLVVFSVYCPANSMGTDEGAHFKIKFMEVLIKRCQNLTKLGKEVLIMGDINISMDLIDQADGINERLKKKEIAYKGSDGEMFERMNLPQCLSFKSETPSRSYFNKFVRLPFPSVSNYDAFLDDTTRLFQGRKMGIYTCWNTMNGSRQTNYGSRIDLILTTKKWSETLVKAGNWPFLLGSDHCPIFSDFKASSNGISKSSFSRKLDFECKYVYKLVKHRDISSMFKSVKRKSETDFKQPENGNTESIESKLSYKSRKKNDQRSINSFFKSKSLVDPLDEYLAKDSLEFTTIINSTGSTQETKKGLRSFASIYGDPPKCKHGEVCQLKTSLNNSKTRGKKFWCCPKTSVGLDDNGRCSYFKWLDPSLNT